MSGYWSRGFVVCLAFCLVNSGILAQPSPVIEVLYPDTDKIAASSADHYIIGRVDTSKVARLELSNFVERSGEIAVQPMTLKQDFAGLVKRLFGEHFQITRIDIQAHFPQGAPGKGELSADFLRQNRVDIKTFWDSREFQKIFTAAMKDTNATKISVHLEGYKVDIRDIANPENLGRFQQYYVFRLTLNPGANEIVLRALDQAGRALQEKQVTYIFKSRIDKKTEVPSTFKEQQFHTPGKESACGNCHQMTPTPGESAQKSAAAKSCYPCHKRLTEDRYVHGPITTWSCLYCHEAVNTGQFSTPADSAVAQTCYKCHQTQSQQFRSSLFIHGPVAAGDCSLCHSPHGSNYPGQILMPATQLCVTCHGERYTKDHPVVKHPVQGVRDPLDSNRELSCISCHSPHHGQTRSLFYTATGLYQLCQECHKK